MLEGTLSVYAFFILFPLAVAAAIALTIRYHLRKTEWCDCNDAEVAGKTIIVTGGSSGLGRILSRELAGRGARVIVACRTKSRRDSTAFFLRSKTGSLNIRVKYVDFSRLDSIKEFARDIAFNEERVDAIVNNAGVLCPRDYTADGLDMMMGINYVGHFLLVNLLLDRLRERCGRIINVLCSSFQYGSISSISSSLEGKPGGYSYRHEYRNSKLALWLFNRQMAKNFRSEHIISLAVDPGFVKTGLYRQLTGLSGKIQRGIAQLFYRTPEEGMQSILHAILSPELANNSGQLVRDCRIVEVRRPDCTDQFLAGFWDKTADLIRSKGINFSLKDEDIEEEEEEDLCDQADLEDMKVRIQELHGSGRRQTFEEEEEDQ